MVRHEARLRRGAFRDLRVPGCTHDALDNPWTFLEHQADVFALVVGQANPQPGMPDSAWIRRVLPTDDSNRSRWPTHPAWRIVQAATFTPSPDAVRQLMKVEQQSSDIDRRVRVIYGALVSAVALAVPQGGRVGCVAGID